MMAEIGSIVKVSGRRSDTPFGAPSPGSTPTRIPSMTPMTMMTMWCVVMMVAKPSIR